MKLKLPRLNAKHAAAASLLGLMSFALFAEPSEPSPQAPPPTGAPGDPGKPDPSLSWRRLSGDPFNLGPSKQQRGFNLMMPLPLPHPPQAAPVGGKGSYLVAPVMKAYLESLAVSQSPD